MPSSRLSVPGHRISGWLEHRSTDAVHPRVELGGDEVRAAVVTERIEDAADGVDQELVSGEADRGVGVCQLDPVGEHHAVLPGMVERELCVRRAELHELVERIADADRGVDQCLAEVGPAVLDGLAEQVVVIVEVPVHGSGGHTRLARHGAQRDALDVAMGRHQVGGGLEQVPAQTVALTAGALLPSDRHLGSAHAAEPTPGRQLHPASRAQLLRHSIGVCVGKTEDRPSEILTQTWIGAVLTAATATAAADRDRVGRVRSGLDVDALAGAFLGGFDHGVELAVGDLGEPVGSLRVALRLGEDLAALDHIGEAVVEQREHIGCDLLAQPIAGAQILVDPDLHVSLQLLVRATAHGYADVCLRVYTAEYVQTSFRHPRVHSAHGERR